LRSALPALLVAIPILFQPEIRRALEHVGRAQGLIPWVTAPSGNLRAVTMVAAAAGELSRRNWGALIVLERETPLGEYTASGTRLAADISAELLVTLFSPHSPLHDGAVIVHGDQITAAGCILPLPETMGPRRVNGAARGGKEMGTRHRAGIGITEKTDALSVIVSEETARISLANNGRVVQDLDEDRLRRTLSILYKPRTIDHGPAIFRNIRVPNRSS
jgi:diadenylate cyclase